MGQPRKKRLQDEQRSQRRFNTAVLVVTVVVMVIVTAYALTVTNQTGVSLPPYLNQCIPLNGTPVYTSNPTLQIFIQNQNTTIPALIGVSGNCFRPIHTRSTSGVIDIDAFEDRTYTLGDFFLLWGNKYGPTYAIFNKNQIFTYKTDANNNITVYVNSIRDDRFQNMPLPTNANVTSHPFNIAIFYGFGIGYSPPAP